MSAGSWALQGHRPPAWWAQDPGVSLTFPRCDPGSRGSLGALQGKHRGFTQGPEQPQQGPKCQLLQLLAATGHTKMSSQSRWVGRVGGLGKTPAQ